MFTYDHPVFINQSMWKGGGGEGMMYKARFNWISGSFSEEPAFLIAEGGVGRVGGGGGGGGVQSEVRIFVVRKTL